MSKSSEKRRRTAKARAAKARPKATPEPEATDSGPEESRRLKILSKPGLIVLAALLVLGPGFAVLTSVLSKSSSSSMDSATAINAMTTQIRKAEAGGSLPTPADCEVDGAPTTGEFPIYQQRCRDEVETTVAMAGIQACADGTKTGAVIAFQKCIRPKFESFYVAQRQGLETAQEGSALLADNPCAQLIFDVGNARATLLGLQPVKNDVESDHMDLASFAKDWTTYLKAETKRSQAVETELLSVSSTDAASCS